MLRSKRVPRSPETRRRGAFRPRGDQLESRLVLAIDVVNVASAPYGVLLAGSLGGQGGGYSVAELGDVNGDGFDDFAVGGPSVTVNGNNVQLGPGNNSNAYIIFGSRSVTAGTVDWATLIEQARVGTLAPTSINQTGQTNPINGQPGFQFSGLVLTASLNPNATLGASVASAGDVNGDGINDILIGAPGSADFNGANFGAGRAYLIYGGAQLNRSLTAGNTIDVDSPPAGFNMLIFANSGTSVQNFRTGTAVAGVGDVITDSFPDIAIGAPGASIGARVSSGAVYVVSGTVLRTPRQAVIDLSTVGRLTGATTAGVILVGNNTGDLTGASIDTAGNVDGDTTSANQQIADLLIGAPGAQSNTGRTYLVYGAINLAQQAVVTSGVNYIDLSRIGTPGTGTADVPGAVFTGSGGGDLNGFSVSTAGDFNADGLSDFMMGAPGYQTSTGLVTLIYGRSRNGTPGRITGNFGITSLPATVPFTAFTGASVNNLAGYSISEVGRINADQPNEIILGAPGFNNSTGAAYLIPGNLDLFGTNSLANADQTAPLSATLITFSGFSGSTGPTYLGSSVSGRLTGPSQTRTIDSDVIGDVIIGASGFGLTSASVNAGAVFALEGRFIPLLVPTNTSITTSIGVGTPTAPFQISATTPAALPIYVYSNNTITPPFRPAVEIDPTTVVVNGVAFPDATVTATQDFNGDGIPEALVTITPRSDLNLNPGSTVTFTVTGRTLATAANANRRWTGSATVQVTGGSNGGGGGGPASGPPAGVIAATTTTLDYGERFVPTPSTLGRLAYRPIPVNVAIQQFLPERGFNQRIAGFYGAKVHRPRWYSARQDRQFGITTLGKGVFTRGGTKQGQNLTYTHPQPVVPRYLQTEGVPRAARYQARNGN